MRVISGSARGKRLKAPRGMSTRPITDMIKEALFNVIGEHIRGAHVLDLFAGSGSVGIEALSRGAQKAVFVDSSKEAIQVIKENLNSCGFADNYEIYRNDVFRAIEFINKNRAVFNIIFIDPPFTNDKIIIPVLEAVDNTQLLNINGRLIIRTPKNYALPAKLQRAELMRTSRYGESTLYYYGYNEEVRSI